MISAGSPDAVTIADREQTGIALILGCPLVVLAAVGLGNAPSWIWHGDTALVVAYASAVVVALVWICVRAWRMQLRIDEHGVRSATSSGPTGSAGVRSVADRSCSPLAAPVASVRVGEEVCLWSVIEHGHGF
jgi:hypothetical protein